MTREEIRSLIKNLLPRHDKTSKYHDLVVDAAIGKVLAQMYNELWIADSLALQRFTKRYGDITPIDIALDAGVNVYYSAYPANIIPIPDKASGVRRITTRQQGGMTFHPMDSREVELVASGSFFSTITNKIGYVPTQDRIEYYNMSTAVATAGVRMDLLVDFSEYDNDDVVLIPEIGGGEGAFVQRVLQVLAVIPAVDLKDDNKDPIREERNG